MQCTSNLHSGCIMLLMLCIPSPHTHFGFSTLPSAGVANEVGLFKEGGRLISFIYPAQVGWEHNATKRVRMLRSTSWQQLGQLVRGSGQTGVERMGRGKDAQRAALYMHVFSALCLPQNKDLVEAMQKKKMTVLGALCCCCAVLRCAAL